jgi:hypothetical protein
MTLRVILVSALLVVLIAPLAAAEMPTANPWQRFSEQVRFPSPDRKGCHPLRRGLIT